MFGHFSFEGIVNSCNIDFFGQDLLALVDDQVEKEFPASLLETPIVHVEVLGTRRLSQPTMLQYKDLAINGSNNYVAVHVDLILVLPDLAPLSVGQRAACPTFTRQQSSLNENYMKGFTMQFLHFMLDLRTQNKGVWSLFFCSAVNLAYHE